MSLLPARWKSMLRFLATAPLVTSVPSYGTPLTVVVAGTQNEYSDTGGFLAFPLPDPDTPWVLTFTYDDATPDSVSDPMAGQYRGAIAAIGLTIGNETFQSLANNSVTVLNDVGNPVDGYADLWLANTWEEAERRLEFGLILVNFGARAVGSDALITPAWPYPPWTFGMIQYSVYDRSGPDSDEWVSRAIATADVTSIAVVPLPPTFWLLGTVCLGGLAWMRRKSPA
jgi:hypothetical protein